MKNIDKYCLFESNTTNQAIVIKDTAGTVLDLGAAAGTSGKNNSIY